MRRIPLALAAALALAGRALAQQPDLGDAKVTHDRDIVATTEWLSFYVDSPTVHVIHVGRDDSGFRAGHIPGAHFLPLSAVATTVNGVPNEFPAPDRMAAAFRALGVGDDGRIVLYGDDAGLLAARAWVALDLLRQSHRAAVLDGGFAKWRAENRAVETAVRPVTARPLSTVWHADRVVSAAWVRAHLSDGTVQFVDARPAEAFRGVEPPCPPAQPACAQTPAARRGHLPGATDLPWMSLVVSAENPVLRPMHDLHEQAFSRAGADRPAVRTVVTYCHTGMQASFDYFVARYVGYHDVRLYDGSMAQWAALPAAEYPVAAGDR